MCNTPETRWEEGERGSHEEGKDRKEWRLTWSPDSPHDLGKKEASWGPISSCQPSCLDFRSSTEWRQRGGRRVLVFESSIEKLWGGESDSSLKLPAVSEWKAFRKAVSHSLQSLSLPPLLLVRKTASLIEWRSLYRNQLIEANDLKTIFFFARVEH